ncbi:MAG: phosphoadenosine phosphosulfate reductase family protein [Candidatus Accumulibacter sp.]|jgi:3'-phosphoadenosine 5'-phosphosulfate sulfotransferase (PAPS reductase)/FAD synthetase|nr:phosphoadenosine phosphosulfate reductase family protein [Accumulibacter sp.]
MTEHNIISFSGGKDSTAMLLLAIERETPSLSVVFADTGNEHEQTYDYVRYVEQATGVPIRWVKADFSRQIAGKREFVLTKWSAKWGAPQDAIDRAVAALVPTGIPFLDLCIWKGRFPSTMRAFCSEELKRNPIIEQVQRPALETGDVISWQGVRRDESLNRRYLVERELKLTYENGNEMWNYRPILDWTADDCFAMHRKHGIKHNPLYEQGMGRVGCMPCINARKDELLEISKRFPEVIERIAQWEKAVALASKRGASTFFAIDSFTPGMTNEEQFQAGRIEKKVIWAASSRGGRQRDFLREMNDGPVCSSIYGLCE